MSRSNDPATNATGWPGGRAPAAEKEQQSWSTWLRGRRSAGEQQQGYHYPQQPPQTDPYAQQPAPAQGYGEPYEPLMPGHPTYGQPPQQQNYGYAPQQPAYDPHSGHAGYPPEPALSQLTPRGAGQHDYGQFGGAPDPRSYDLGSYGPDPRYDHAYAEPDHGGPLYGNLRAPPEPGENALEAYGTDDADYDYEEPRRGGRKFLMVGALVGAVAAAGGLAYGYRTVVGPTSDTATPVIRQDSRPDKTKPADPGGKQFAHTDSKILGRLGDAAPAAAPAGVVVSSSAQAATNDEDSNGQRKVQTVTIGRDGSIIPPAAPPQPTVSVPGLTVVDGFGGRSTPSNGPSLQQQPPVVVTRSLSQGGESPQPPPQKTAVATTTAAPAATPAPAAAALPQKPAVVAKVAPAVPAKTSSDADDLDAVVPQNKKAAPPKRTETAAVGANGYVAVLASVPASSQSRMDALKQFADLQQKYSSVLQNKTPDVQEADLGSRGTYHRLLVGPPGSRDQASALCTQLKAAGFAGCWVTAY